MRWGPGDVLAGRGYNGLTRATTKTPPPVGRNERKEGEAPTGVGRRRSERMVRRALCLQRNASAAECDVSRVYGPFKEAPPVLMTGGFVVPLLPSPFLRMRERASMSECAGAGMREIAEDTKTQGLSFPERESFVYAPGKVVEATHFANSQDR